MVTYTLDFKIFGIIKVNGEASRKLCRVRNLEVTSQPQPSGHTYYLPINLVEKAKMKILGINGSQRKDGNSYLFLKSALEAAKEEVNLWVKISMHI